MGMEIAAIGRLVFLARHLLPPQNPLPGPLSESHRFVGIDSAGSPSVMDCFEHRRQALHRPRYRQH
ncbi:hypothetical protein C4D60_Mb04t03430 [Musa balbisiana]|uniref:Uncharacterized protein n=1 Tax=Musa balbisiana TaxID=52838 RepID=A0A4V4H9H7_MUSBA|nr:hypothetical protein C4D60_Mb04t03430 [Musa balbisiana]